MKLLTWIVLAALAIGVFQLGASAKYGNSVAAGGKTGDVIITG